MFEKVLVPLDGSEPAEVALLYGEELAKRVGSELILFHACRPEHKLYSHMHEMYLDSMAETVRGQIRRGRPQGAVKVKAEMAVGEPVQTICDYVDKNRISLVIMSTSGASGAKPGHLGGVVDKVIRTLCVATLLTRPENAQQIGGRKPLISRILVPLDGSERSKAALPVAEELALKLKVSITLFRMAARFPVPVETLASSIPGYYAQIDKAELGDAQADVIKVEKGLRDKGVPVTHSVVTGTDAAYEIVEAGKKSGADLVVMATHGRSPLGRFVFGSITEKVVRGGDLPVLLVREAKA